jgi:hypothetical protein
MFFEAGIEQLSYNWPTKVVINLFQSTPVCSEIGACPPATMVAKMVFNVTGRCP